MTSPLQIDAHSEPALRETLHETPGILVAGSTGELDARSDLGAILTED